MTKETKQVLFNNIPIERCPVFDFTQPPASIKPSLRKTSIMPKHIHAGQPSEIIGCFATHCIISRKNFRKALEEAMASVEDSEKVDLDTKLTNVQFEQEVAPNCLILFTISANVLEELKGLRGLILHALVSLLGSRPCIAIGITEGHPAINHHPIVSEHDQGLIADFIEAVSWRVKQIDDEKPTSTEPLQTQKTQTEPALKSKRIVGAIALDVAMPEDDLRAFLELNGLEQASDVPSTRIHSKDFEFESRMMVYGARSFVLRSLTSEAVNTDALVRVFDRLIMTGRAYIGVVRRSSDSAGMVYLRGRPNKPREDAFKESFLSLLHDEATHAFNEAVAIDSRSTSPSFQDTLVTVKHLNHILQCGLEKKVFDTEGYDELRLLVDAIDRHTSNKDVTSISSLVLSRMIAVIESKLKSLD